MENTLGQQVIHCPNCGGRHVKDSRNPQFDKTSKLVWWGITIPVIGWFVLLPLGVVQTIFNRMNAKKYQGLPVNMYCMGCKSIFQVTQDTYVRYKRAVSGYVN